MIRLEGDKATIEDLNFFKRFGPQSCTLVNGLGTSETGLCRQFFFEKEAELPTKIVPVGYPVEDMVVFVAGENGKPVTANQLGEIAVRSRFLSSGYWDDAERTAKSFLQDTENEDFRIFKTGNLGRMHEDGCLECLERAESVSEIQRQISRDTPITDSSNRQHTTQNKENQNSEPDSPTGKVLISIWANILNRESIRTSDDFLLLNGVLIKAMRMVNQINLELSTEISLRDLFSNHVLSDLAKFIDFKAK